ncbi:NUDIX domain-containing protein [Methylobrevis albus]|uniref:GDP-mannose pyrophosphatase n=1 Tax=Methylobrevis albus TaxID=2793297 RepID=A0A931I167_9HYPH|nr:NUDIX hydrolase [Methylobrevis albus]MBH0238305.1 NUDIX hydrolase [Methylobrevis albus]
MPTPDPGAPALPRIVSRRRLHGGWNRLDVVEIDLGDGVSIVREVVDHGDGAAALVFDPLRRTALMVRQVRAGKLDREGGDGLMLEVPAGLVDPGEVPAETARREIGEETGCVVGELRPVVVAYPSGGSLSERLSLFLAEADLGSAGGAGFGLAAEGEQIEVVIVPLAELAAAADAGNVDDLKSFALIQTLRLRRPELFSAT